MQTQINTSIALNLHAFGLAQLHDPNWTGMDLFDRLKQHTRGRQEPTSLLFNTSATRWSPSASMVETIGKGPPGNGSSASETGPHGL
jgi:hypothetical protein